MLLLLLQFGIAIACLHRRIHTDVDRVTDMLAHEWMLMLLRTLHLPSMCTRHIKDFGFSQHTDKASLKNAISGLVYNTGPTYACQPGDAACTIDCHWSKG